MYIPSTSTPVRNFSPRTSGFDFRSVHVEFEWTKLALGPDFLRVLQFGAVSPPPPPPSQRVPYSYICHLLRRLCKPYQQTTSLNKTLLVSLRLSLKSGSVSSSVFVETRPRDVLVRDLFSWRVRWIDSHSGGSSRGSCVETSNSRPAAPPMGL
jgi:hypothetical protein